MTDAHVPLAVASAHARDGEEVARALGVDAARGLDDDEANRRRALVGPNRLEEAPREPAWRILARQFGSVVVALLAAAAAVSWAMGDRVEAVAVGIVVAANAVIGFVTEVRAVRAMESLARIGRAEARVRRGGVSRPVPAEELVPGDVVDLEAGDRVPADARILESSRAEADESALTGESVPVSKSPARLAEDTRVADRSNVLHRGTALTRGSAVGVVVATGRATEVGRIADLVAATGEPKTPLERRIDELGRRLAVVAIAVAAAVALAGVLLGREPGATVLTAIALAVAAVPEGLPIVATLALARGVLRMARRNAVVNRLAAVEVLGGTGVVGVDKTGTITEGRLAVSRIVVATGTLEVGSGRFARAGRTVRPSEDANLAAALEIGALCSNASIDGAPTGDPLEVALLDAARDAGITRAELLARRPEIREEAFDPDVRMMATFHEIEGGALVAVKGAPEDVLVACTHESDAAGAARPLDDAGRARWTDANRALADDGLRVLALARKLAPTDAAPYRGLTLVGLVGLVDPPRADVRDAVAACRAAGVAVVMITGDQPATARAIARAVGIPVEGPDAVAHGRELARPDAWSDTDRERLRRATVVARATPEEKLALVALHQAAGSVVAMTGDGVNDAPALRRADLGIAMGRRGTQVAREAADVVLGDDAFRTVVVAIEEGRIVFANVRKFVLYLLSCNVSEILVVTVAVLAGLPLLLLPLQILFLNLVTDVFPALALGAGRGDAGTMTRPPRDPREPLVSRRHWRLVLAHAGVLTAATLLAFGLARRLPGVTDAAVGTVAFLALAGAQLVHVLNMREPGAGLWNDVTRNPWVWVALGFCVLLIAGALAVPPVADALGLERLPPMASAIVGGAALLPRLAGGLVERAVGAGGDDGAITPRAIAAR